MKRFALAIMLACVLSDSALAGDVHTTGAPAPVPGDSHTVGAAAPGDIHTTGDPVSTTQSSSVAAKLILAILSFVR
jgi:hypothetical protein